MVSLSSIIKKFKQDIEDIRRHISNAVRWKGSVENYNNLPSKDLTMGDMYNIQNADPSHDVKKGDNVVWNGSEWDVLSGLFDTSGLEKKISDGDSKLSKIISDNKNAQDDKNTTFTNGISKIKDVAASIIAIAKSLNVEPGINPDGTPIPGKTPGVVTPPSTDELPPGANPEREKKTLINRLREIEKYIIDITSTDAKNPVKRYIDNMDKLNLSPKVGYIDEKTVPLHASYAMNFIAINRKNFYTISDSYGREVTYVMASTGAPGSPARVFRGTRISSIDSFVFENVPIKANYMEENDYIERITAVGADYIVYYCSFNGQMRTHLVHTYGSSNPDLWKNYEDITDIANYGYCFGMQYFSDYDTVALYHTPGTNKDFKLTIKLFRLSDHSLIKSAELTNIFDDFKPDSDIAFQSGTGSSYDGLWIYDSGEACYVRKAKRLIFMLRIGLNSCAGDRVFLHHSSTHSWAFSVPDSFFKDGSGTVTRISSNDYHVKPFSLYGGNNISGYVWGTLSMSYDEYEDVFRITCMDRDNYSGKLFAHAVPDFEEAHVPAYGLLDGATYVTTPDAMPWGKFINSIFTMFGRVFVSCKNSTAHTLNMIEPRKSTAYDNYIECIPGKSARVSNEVDLNLVCGLRAGDSMRYFYPKDGKIQEVFFENNKIFAKDVGLPPVPTTTPQGATLVRFISYDPSRNTYTYVGYDTAPETKNYPIVCVYSIQNKTWTVHKDYSKYAWQLLDYYKQNYNLRQECRTNQYGGFTDTNGDIVFQTYFSYGNWARCRIAIFHSNDGTVSGGKRDASDGWGIARMDWHKDFGYTQAQTDWGYGSKPLYCGKDYCGTNSTEKSLADVADGDAYVIRFGVSSASGLVAYISEMPIFLGGYFSVCPAQEIALKPNCNNYIYLSRDRTDREKINIYVKDKQFGQDGETVFNRILVARVKTNSANAIETQYFTIGTK